MSFSRRLFILVAFFVLSLPLPALAITGEAQIRGTAEDSPLHGTVLLQDAEGGLNVSLAVTGVPSGRHGFHIHEFGSCADSGNAAGGHFNPEGVEHGYLPEDGLESAHAGDLGNIDIGPDGKGSGEWLIRGLSVAEGPYSVAGRAFIIHEKEDDFSQPTGNAGARIGCGAIVITS